MNKMISLLLVLILRVTGSSTYITNAAAVALYLNWEVLAAEDYNLEVWIKNIYGDKVQSFGVAATHLSSNRQSCTISDIGFMQGLYEGNVNFFGARIIL